MAKSPGSKSRGPISPSPISLGIDTGGTYTDAVLFEDGVGVIASAKSLTTRHDFSVGIGRSIDAVIDEADIESTRISLVSMSTTLATNALVEGHGGRVCLVLIGFDAATLTRSGLSGAMKDDPVLFLPGGHTAHGDEVTPLELGALRDHLSGLEVSAFAVASMFGVRNPDHENRVRDLILEITGRPVTCSHELSSKLDGPRRALTCVLNARLINMIHHLIHATEDLFAARSIEAPLMVVQGDGALISSDVARLKPIETILSGPAASLVGAAYLTGETEAVVSDIGGTTTDIAILSGGQPRLDEDGATVGGWQTMVEAVAMHTVGLGGDSEVGVTQAGMDTVLKLGPRRLIPLSLFATDHADLVHGTLGSQLKQPRLHDHAGRFAIAVGRQSAHLTALTEPERGVLDRLAGGPMALDKLTDSRRAKAALERLVAHGLVMLSGMTPSDAAHVLCKHEGWDRDAALKGAALFARQKGSTGLPISPDPVALSGWIVDTLVQISAETLLEASMIEDGFMPSTDARKLLAANDQASANMFIAFQMGLKVPLVGLGASAATYYPDVAERLRTTALIPEHAGVANALGAVVGQVRVAAEATITQPEPGCFRVFLAGVPKNFGSFEKAISYVEGKLHEEAEVRAREAGAGEIDIRTERDDNVAIVEGQEMLVESHVRTTASGRPRVSARVSA